MEYHGELDKENKNKASEAVNFFAIKELYQKRLAGTSRNYFTLMPRPLATPEC